MEKKNYKVGLFCIVTSLFWFSMYSYVPILPDYLHDINATDQMIGIITGSYGFTQMVLRIPLGILSDHIKKRKLFIILGLLFTLISGAGLLLSSDHLVLILIFRALAGVAASTWVSFTILYSSYYDKSQTTKAIGTINFFNNTGQMLAMLIGGFVVQLFTYNASFILSTIAGVIGLSLSFLIVENYEEHEKITLKGLRTVITNRNLIIVSIFAIFAQMIIFATAFSFTVRHAKIIGASDFELGILTFASTLPSAIASLVGARYFAKLIGERRMVIIGFILMGIFTVSIPFTSTFILLLITQFISGIGRGLAFPILMSSSIKEIDSSKKSTAMGFFQAVYGIGMTLGPILMGFISDKQSLKVGFIGFGIFSCVTAVIYYFVTKKDHQKMASLEN